MPKAAGQNHSARRPATVAGLALIGMAVLAPIAVFGILSDLVVRGATAETAQNLAESTAALTLAMVLLLIVVVLDIVVALALFAFFRPVRDGLVYAMTASRLLYAAAFLAAISQLARAATTTSASNSIDSERAAEYALRFEPVWDAALVLFAVHLVLLGWLFWRTQGTPTWLGGLLLIAGLGYGVDSLGTLLTDGYSFELSTVTFVGEIVLIFWLLIKGRLTVIGTAK